jgi:hypothetical protein
MTVYYCSKEVGASDSNSGLSPLLPFLTAGKQSATALLNAGDSYLFRRGDSWPENLQMRGNGAPNNPITFGAYGSSPYRPIITAADIPTFVFDSAVAGGDRYKAAALGFSPGYVHREDGAIVGQGTMRNLQNKATLVTCTALHDWHYTGVDLYVVVATGEVPGTNITVHATRRNICINEFGSAQDYLKIQSIHCRFSLDGSFYGCIHSSSNSVVCSGWVIDDVITEWGGSGVKFGGLGTNSFADDRVFTMTNSEHRFHREHGAQIIYVVDGSVISGNYFHGNGRQGLGLAMRNGTASNNRYEDNAGILNKWTSASTVQGFDAGLYVVGQEPTFTKSSGNTFWYEIAKNNAKAGIATDALSNNHRFIRCLSINNTVFGFEFEGGGDNSSSGNAVYHGTATGNQQSGLHVFNNHGGFTAKNCIFYGNGLATNKQDVYVSFNIFNNGSAWTLHAGSVYKKLHHDWDPVNLSQDDHTVLTKVGGIPGSAGQWFWDSGAEIVYVWKTDGTAPTTCYGNPSFDLDYNCYTPTASLPSGNAMLRGDRYNGSFNYTTIAAIQAGISQEAHGIAADPTFMDAAGGNYALRAGSACIDRGIVIIGVNDGTGGSVRFAGAGPCIGYLEFVPVTYGAGSAAPPGGFALRDPAASWASPQVQVPKKKWTDIGTDGT